MRIPRSFPLSYDLNLEILTKFGDDRVEAGHERNGTSDMTTKSTSNSLELNLKESCLDRVALQFKSTIRNITNSVLTP